MPPFFYSKKLTPSIVQEKEISDTYLPDYILFAHLIESVAKMKKLLDWPRDWEFVAITMILSEDVVISDDNPVDNSLRITIILSP